MPHTIFVLSEMDKWNDDNGYVEKMRSIEYVSETTYLPTIPTVNIYMHTHIYMIVRMEEKEG